MLSLSAFLRALVAALAMLLERMLCCCLRSSCCGRFGGIAAVPVQERAMVQEIPGAQIVKRVHGQVAEQIVDLPRTQVTEELGEMVKVVINRDRALQALRSRSSKRRPRRRPSLLAEASSAPLARTPEGAVLNSGLVGWLGVAAGRVWVGLLHVVGY